MSDMIPVPPGQAGQSPFDAIRRTHPDSGVEYWSARDLMPHLGYTRWQNFTEAIDRARCSCQNTGCDPDSHFTAASKVSELSQMGPRSLPDVHLSRYACYLVAMNGDPRKPQIAAAQQYFVIQTRRAEMGLASGLPWEQARLKGKSVRRTFTDVLKDHAVTGGGYGQCTDAINRHVLGGTAKEFREQRGLQKSALTRDHCDAMQLVNLSLSEQVSATRIERENVRGNTPCAHTCDRSADDVMQAVQKLLSS